MKIRYGLAVPAVLLISWLTAPGIATANTGPIAAYSFDEGSGSIAHDSIGSHDGTLKNGAEWTSAGKYGGAIHFDGVNDLVTIPAASDLNLSENFTLEAWIRPEGLSEWDAVLSKETSSFHSYVLIPEGEHKAPVAYVAKDSEHNYAINGTSQLPLNTWSHLALTSDGEHLRLYVNGTQVASVPSAAVFTAEGPTQIGGNVLLNEHFKGLIDEVRIYNRTLSGSEITQDKEVAIGWSRQSHLIAAYSFDEGSGSIAHDSIGSHDGTLKNGAEWTSAGKYGGAIHFDGINDLVTVPTSSELSLSKNFTIEAWVRPEEANEWSAVLTKEIPSGLSYQLHAEGEHKAPAGFVAKDAEGHNYAINGTSQLPLNTWSHLALTSDGEHLRLYVNGTQVASVPSGAVVGGEGALQIGDDLPWLSEDGFKGLIDEVRIYNRTLSGSEITQDKEASTPPNTVIDVGPNGPTQNSAPRFEYHSTQAYSTFECRVDEGAWGSCSAAGFTSTSLGEGRHRFEVRAIDQFNQKDPSPAAATIFVDKSAPMARFESTAAPNLSAYSLTIEAEDEGSTATGIKRIDLLLNGEIVKTTSNACNADGICYPRVNEGWSHQFAESPQINPQMKVLVFDAAGNVATYSFLIPSNVVHASLYSANPQAGGRLLADEWLDLGTHVSRQEKPDGVLTTRGLAPCPEEPRTMCNIFRTNASSPTAPSGVISEGIAPVAEAAALSEATTLALTSMRDFGEVRETGPISTIAQSWQVLPPNSGATYELRESRNSSEPVAGSVEGDWKFWVDQATGLPIKASVTGENIEPEVSYYTYASSLLEAGNLPPDFFLMEGSQSPSCVAGGTLGGWTFNEDAFVAQDARAPAVVYGAAGPITLRPVGAAADGLMSRAELQASGIELSSRGSDEQNLHWTIEGEESYSFKEDGSNIIIEGESGEPAAVLSERTANTSVVNASAVEEESGAADELVLHPDQTPARVSVQAVESGRRFSPCITKEDQERAAAVHQEVLEEEAQMPSYGPEASSSISTTQIKIWINPHPGLAGTAVTDKYEVCNSPHTKLFGSDGYVVFGGCPVGRSVTFTVPEQVEANGVTYRVPDASRTLSPPASGWVITFGYSEVSSSGGWTPNPGGEIENEMIEVGGNEAEASSTPHNANPATACTMWVSIPYRTHTAIGYTAEAWLAVRCTKSHFVENWEAHHYLYSEPQMLNPEPREERAHRHYWEVPVWEAGSYQSALEQKFISTACNALNISKWWNSAKRFISYGEIPGEGPYVTKPSFKTVHKKISCG